MRFGKLMHPHMHAMKIAQNFCFLVFLNTIKFGCFFCCVRARVACVRARVTFYFLNEMRFTEKFNPAAIIELLIGFPCFVYIYICFYKYVATICSFPSYPILQTPYGIIKPPPLYRLTFLPMTFNYGDCHIFSFCFNLKLLLFIFLGLLNSNSNFENSFNLSPPLPISIHPSSPHIHSPLLSPYPFTPPLPTSIHPSSPHIHSPLLSPYPFSPPLPISIHPYLEGNRHNLSHNNYFYKGLIPKRTTLK